MINRMFLPALKRNLCHKPGLFFGATSNRAVGKVILLMGETALLMGAVIFPAEKSFCSREKSFCSREKSFFRRRNRFTHGRIHFANGSSRFSDGKVVLQICKPPYKLAKPFYSWEKSFYKWEKSFYKWEKSFLRRRNRFAHGRNRFSDGKVTWQICRMAGLASKTKQNGVFTNGTGLKWMASSLPASREDSPLRAGRFRNDQAKFGGQSPHFGSKFREPVGLIVELTVKTSCFNEFPMQLVSLADNRRR